MNSESLLGIGSPQSVDPQPLPAGDQPAWTFVEAAIAAGGVEHRSYLAARFTYGGDDSVKGECQALLVDFCTEQHTLYPQVWPERVTINTGVRRRYFETLAQMHLAEERNPAAFLNVDAYTYCTKTIPRVWYRVLAPLYQTLRHEWLTWQSSCLAIMQRRISGY